MRRPFNEGKVKDFAEVGVRTPDPYTVEVTLDNPTPFFLDLCAFSTLLPVHLPSVEACTQRGESWTKPGRSSSATEPTLCRSGGPLTASAWPKTQSTGTPRTSACAASTPCPPPNRNTAFNFYATGVADLMVDKVLTPTGFIDRDSKKAAGFSFGALPRKLLPALQCNPQTVHRSAGAPGLQPRHRQRTCSPKNITRASAELPADSLTPPGTANYEPPPGLKRDPERARNLLAEAGYPGGAGFPIVYYLTTGDVGGVDADIGVEMQGMLKRELGIGIQLQRQEWQVYLNSLSRLDYDFCRSSWVGDYNDANTFLGCFVTDDGNNRTGWSNPHFDELIAAAGREPDRQRRADLFRQAERILVSEEVP